MAPVGLATILTDAVDGITVTRTVSCREQPITLVAVAVYVVVVAGVAITVGPDVVLRPAAGDQVNVGTGGMNVYMVPTAG